MRTVIHGNPFVLCPIRRKCMSGRALRWLFSRQTVYLSIVVFSSWNLKHLLFKYEHLCFFSHLVNYSKLNFLRFWTVALINQVIWKHHLGLLDLWWQFLATSFKTKYLNKVRVSTSYQNQKSQNVVLTVMIPSQWIPAFETLWLCVKEEK